MTGPQFGGVPERLARDVFHPDETPHLAVDQAAVRASGIGPVLVAVCPAHVFRESADGTIEVEHVACLECGTCLAVAPPRTLTWHYPPAGRGIAYREG